MNNEDLKKAIDFYRSLVQKEIASEKIVDGKLIGPRTLIKKDHLDLNDIINPERSFLGKDVTDDLDSVYVTTFRIGNLKKPMSLAKSGYGTDIIAGIEMGVKLVKTGIIKNFDEISEFLAKYKVGILDIFKEEEIKNGKRLDIRVYECIECAGLPNIGEPVCYFETGMIIGILGELTHKEVFAEEIRCWTSGYSFCHFDVEIKD
ncbi:MAG: V4R domain-containing protein [Methanobacterium formicicum]